MLVRGRCLGVLNRGLQNLGAPCKGTDCHFLRCAKSNQKAHGTPSCDLRFKALPEKILAKFSSGTCRTRLFAQNGGEKALNRCEVQALQRKELEQR